MADADAAARWAAWWSASARLDTPGVDVRTILRKHAIPDAHGEAAVEEARRLGARVRPRDLAGARTSARAPS